MQGKIFSACSVMQCCKAAANGFEFAKWNCHFQEDGRNFFWQRRKSDRPIDTF